MKEFWDERYSEEGYAYGDEPNVYFKEQLEKIESPGKLLMPAEGEGRNAIYAAELGWNVDAFDQSVSGKEKATQLASERGVQLNYWNGGFETLNDKVEEYDAIGLIYAHFPPHLRTEFHQQLINSLKKGGKIIIEGFSEANLPYREKDIKIGGPGDIGLLYSIEKLASDFEQLEMVELVEEKVELNEGKYHVGEGVVIRCVAIKK